MSAKHLRPAGRIEAPAQPQVSAGLSLAVFVGSFLVCLARARNPSQRFSFWAEDGRIFTMQVRASGIFHSFFTTYAGYLHLLPRSVAAIASTMPLEWAPPFYATSAMLVASAVATLSFSAARGGLRLGMGPALILAAYVLVLPGGSFEVVGNLTNVQWYCLAGVIVYVVAWFEGWQTNPYLTGALLFVAATTTPLAAFALPFFVVRLFRNRSRLDFAVSAGLYGGFLVMLISHFASREGSVGAVSPRNLTALYAVRAAAQAPLGDRFLQVFYFTFGERASAVVGVLLGVILLAGSLQVLRRSWTPFLLLLTSVILYLVSAIERDLSALPHLGFPPTETGLVTGGRYFAVPTLCLALAGLLLLVRRRDEGGLLPTTTPLPGVYRNLLLLAGAWMGGVLLLNVPQDYQRFPLHTWEQSVASARTSCATDNTHRVVIENAPGGPVWRIDLSCRQAFGR